MEKFDHKYCKLQLDLDFLQSCQKHNVIPKFLQFKLTNRNSKSPWAYSVCQKTIKRDQFQEEQDHPPVFVAT